MAQRMLIDAAHKEETRVVVLSGSRLEHFDFESSTKKQLKGNIYLAKVTRVEPSLQAAFIEYGGNRHGFLSFNEIHPDYYQIPIADREALVAEEKMSDNQSDSGDQSDDVSDESNDDASDDAPDPVETADSDTDDDGEGENQTPVDNEFEEIGGDDVEELEKKPTRPQRHYRIQEVIKRRQILLVQVVKEERGTKGAALTTYISLAGRYCVLVPNTARGGGISRKIVNPDDRKRLRSIASELPVAEGMGVILRTAGMERSKAEIKRDFNYLLKLWDTIREHTFSSTAPALIHEEANLINRSLRDLYSKEIDEVIVEGDEGYRMAKEFMRMLMPSHARRIKAYEGATTLFQKYQVESQLDAFHNSTVHLKSGGYIVINPTEALVAIDVNSGRATRERSIEETATKTNLEASEEIARQLKLRDLAGLIVIDFIDMENSRNIRNVERCMKEAMKSDRARIQMGRISHFGLMEMSRQRLRSSLLESSSHTCPHCDGSGQIRSTESTALHVLRAIEEEGSLARSKEITVHVPVAVALYILNRKREALMDVEKNFALTVTIEGDDSLIPPDYRLDRDGVKQSAEQSGRSVDADGEKPGRKRRRRRSRGQREDEDQVAIEVDQDSETPVSDSVADSLAAADSEDGEGRPRDAAADNGGEADGARKRRRRGKRGGRRRRRGSGEQPVAEAAPAEAVVAGEGEQPYPVESEQPVIDSEAPEAAAAEPDAAESVADSEEAPAKPRRSRRKPAAGKTAKSDDDKPDEEEKPQPEPQPESKPRPRRSRSRKKAEDATVDAAPADAVADDGGNGPSPVIDTPSDAIIVEPAPEVAPQAAVVEAVAAEQEAPKSAARKGWWNRLTS